MPPSISIRHVLAAILVAGLATSAGPAAAEPPERLRFHGTILQLGGFSPLDGGHVFHARIYDQAQDGILHFGKIVNVTVSGGAYVLTLEPDSPGELAAVFADGPRFLEIEVLSGPGGPIGEILQPRQEITAVPYALNAFSSSDGGVPEGAIILWDQSSSCPPGYQDEPLFAGRFPRGQAAGGQVGAQGGSSNTGVGSNQRNISSPSVTFGGGNNFNHGNHVHAFTPPYRDVLFCRKLPQQ